MSTQSDFSPGSMLPPPDPSALQQLQDLQVQEEAGTQTDATNTQGKVTSKGSSGVKEAVQTKGKNVDTVEGQDLDQTKASAKAQLPHWVSKGGIPNPNPHAAPPPPSAAEGNPWLAPSYVAIYMAVMTELAMMEKRSALMSNAAIMSDMKLGVDLSKSQAKATIAGGEADYNSHMAQAYIGMVQVITSGCTLVSSFSAGLKSSKSIKEQDQAYGAQLERTMPKEALLENSEKRTFRKGGKDLSPEDQALFEKNLAVPGNHPLREKYLMKKFAEKEGLDPAIISQEKKEQFHREHGEELRKTDSELSLEKNFRDFQNQREQLKMQTKQNLMMNVNTMGQMVNQMGESASHMVQAQFGLEKAMADAQAQLLGGLANMTNTALQSMFDAYKSKNVDAVVNAIHEALKNFYGPWHW